MPHPYVLRRFVLTGVATVVALSAAAPASARLSLEEQRQRSASAAAYERSLVDAGSPASVAADFGVTALAAGLVHPADVSKNGVTVAAATYAQYRDGGVGTNASTLAKTLLVSKAAGLDASLVARDGASGATPRNRNAVADMLARFDGSRLSDGFVNFRVFGALGLAAAPSAPATAEVRRAIADDVAGEIIPVDGRTDEGFYPYDPGFLTPPLGQPSNIDIDTTAAAIASLCTAGYTPADAPVRQALNVLDTEQLNHGGWQTFGESVSATGAAVIGLRTCGIDPQDARWTKPGDVTPLDRLAATQLQNGGWPYPDNGTTADPGFSTPDAARAMSPDASAFTAPAPAVRPVPTYAVPAGEPVQVGVAIDRGAAVGSRRLSGCSVVVPSGAGVEALVGALKASTCIGDVELEGSGLTRRVSAVDGVNESAARGRAWTVTIGDGAPEVAIASRVVTDRPVVALRLRAAEIPVTPTPVTPAPTAPAPPAPRLRPTDALTPSVRVSRVRVVRTRAGRRLVVSGTSTNVAGATLRIEVARRSGSRCQALRASGDLARPAACSSIAARSLVDPGAWALRLPYRGSATGTFRIAVRAVRAGRVVASSTRSLASTVGER